MGKIFGEGLNKLKEKYPSPASILHAADIIGAEFSFEATAVSEKDPRQRFEAIQDELTQEVRKQLEQLIEPAASKFLKREGGEIIQEGWSHYQVRLQFKEIFRGRIHFLVRIHLPFPEGTNASVPQSNSKWK